jgi:hypothetical protein
MTCRTEQMLGDKSAAQEPSDLPPSAFSVACSHLDGAEDEDSSSVPDSMPQQQPPSPTGERQLSVRRSLTLSTIAHQPAVGPLHGGRSPVTKKSSAAGLLPRAKLDLGAALVQPAPLSPQSGLASPMQSSGSVDSSALLPCPAVPGADAVQHRQCGSAKDVQQLLKAAYVVKEGSRHGNGLSRERPVDWAAGGGACILRGLRVRCAVHSGLQCASDVM